MTKTVNINLGGLGFTIDEPAYRMLDDYLHTLREVCGSAGQPETADDIEQRIAEIFAERFTPGASIISLQDVEEVIARIGEPEEIVDIEIETSGGAESVKVEASAGPVPPPFAAPMKKKLFRDKSAKMIGGVCAGLAWYLGVDTVWVRLAVIALCFLSLSTVALVYVILWIVVPEASTPLEKMQMMGVDSSVENVGRVVTGTYGVPGSNSTASRRQVADTFSEILRCIVKVGGIVLVALGLLITIPVLFALCVGLIACVVCLFSPLPFGEINIAPDTRLGLGAGIGCILAVGIPFILLLKYLISCISSSRRFSLTRNWAVALVAIWIAGVACTVVCTLLLQNF